MRQITVVINGAKINGTEEDIRHLLGIELPQEELLSDTLSMQASQIHILPNPGIIKSNGATPAVKEIINFIRGQPDFSHSTTAVSLHFLGKRIDPRINKNTYNALWRKTKRARDKILKEERRKRPLVSIDWNRKRGSFTDPSVFSLRTMKLEQQTLDNMTSEQKT